MVAPEDRGVNMRFDRKQFFDGIKDRIDATLDQQQVNGLEFLLTAIENDQYGQISVI